MDAKIPAAIWSDPDLESQPPEVLLSLLWIKTHPARNDCGAYRFSPGRFASETHLGAEWHERTLAALPGQFVRDGHWVLYVPFIRECLRIGGVTGKNGFVNKGALALTTPFLDLPPALQNVLREHYPDYNVVWPSPCQALTKPLPSPYQALTKPFHVSKPLASPSDLGNQQVPSSERSEMAAAAEALGKPLPTPYQGAEQSRAEQSRAEEGMQGEGAGGGGAEIPSEETVLAFGRQFADLATGLGPIPDSYARKWLAWRCSEKAGPFPRDWKKDLRLRFLADAEDKKTVRRAPEPATSRAAIEAQLKKLPAGDPARKPLLEKLNESAA